MRWSTAKYDSPPRQTTLGRDPHDDIDIGRCPRARSDVRTRIADAARAASLSTLLWRRHLDTGPAVIDFVRGQAEPALDSLFAWIEGEIFPVGTRLAIAACASVIWLDRTGLDTARWPAIARWPDRFKALPGWNPAEHLMPRE